MLQTRRADRLRLLDTLDIKDARASFDATSAAGASSTHEAPTPLPLHSVLIARLACGSHEKEKPTPLATCCHFSRSVVLKADAPSRTGTRKSRTSAAGPSLPPSDALLLRIKNAAERLLRTALDATLQAGASSTALLAAAWFGSDRPPHWDDRYRPLPPNFERARAGDSAGRSGAGRDDGAYVTPRFCTPPAGPCSRRRVRPTSTPLAPVSLAGQPLFDELSRDRAPWR